MNLITYSDFSPTETIATLGASGAANAASMCGSAARTSGHHGCLVMGSSPEMNARKSFALGLSDTSRSFAEPGRVKFLMIGIVAGQLEIKRRF